MITITKTRREFIARIVADLGKTVVGIGLASYLFERFSFLLRVVLSILGPALLAGSVFIEPKEK